MVIVILKQFHRITNLLIKPLDFIHNYNQYSRRKWFIFKIEGLEMIIKYQFQIG